MKTKIEVQFLLTGNGSSGADTALPSGSFQPIMRLRFPCGHPAGQNANSLTTKSCMVVSIHFDDFKHPAGPRFLPVADHLATGWETCK